jgi:tetratricopeptide (TPR) repeat protein
VSNLGAQEVGSRPWAKGVKEADQKAAEKLFEDGNELLKQSFFKQAAEKYRKALSHWDHPGIHYNIALALLSLDEPSETHDHLEAALAYGPAPLEQDKYEYGKKYLALVDKQLGMLEVSCQEQGAIVRLDGQVLFHAPGEYKGLVRRGEHTLTATKPGLETTQISRTFNPDEPVKLNLQLYRPDELVTYTRRTPLWLPIGVTVLGGMIAGTGGILAWQAQKKYDQWDADVRDDPNCVGGCFPDDDLNKTKSQGDTLRTMSYVAYGLGAAVFTGGVVWASLNRRQAHRVDPEDMSTKVSFVPQVSPQGVGLTAVGQF